MHRSTYIGRISTERTDMFLHPRYGRELVPEPEIHRTKLPRFRSLRKPERPEAIVDANVHYRCSLDRTISLVPAPVPVQLASRNGKPTLRMLRAMILLAG